MGGASAPTAMKAYREGKYAATGRWGFGDFKDGKPSDEALHKACFPCHEPAKARDFVFSQYAP